MPPYVRIRNLLTFDDSMVAMASIPEHIQEEEYDFPYHHLVDMQPFSETRHLFWGYRYAGYVKLIAETLKDMRFESLIEIGCGDGKVLTEIARRCPGKRLMGVDYSEKSLRFARAFSPHLEFATNTDETFDGFVLIEVLEHINPSEMTSFLDSVRANLKPGGFGIITTPSTNLPVNAKHYQHFTRESFEKTIGSHFTIERFEYISAWGYGPRLIQSFLANRLFILNFRPLVSFLYSLYERRYVHATPSTGSQVFAIVRRKD